MKIPKLSAQRLSQLARILEQYPQENKNISSTELEQLTGWTHHTIRKDISFLGGNYDFSTTAGYDPKNLARVIRKNLGYTSEEQRCCIVGLGRLGTAFIDYPGFEQSQYKLCAGFDSNVNRIEILKAPFPLYPSYKMEKIIPQLNIIFAILCVPTNKAQEMAEKLVDCGIKGIVNFSSNLLTVPANVEIENVSLIDALSLLKARLAAKK